MKKTELVKVVAEPFLSSQIFCKSTFKNTYIHFCTIFNSKCKKVNEKKNTCKFSNNKNSEIKIAKFMSNYFG